MQLTSFSDYALRLLLYLGAHDGALSQLAEVARVYGVSQHHLEKVAAHLAHLGFVESVRGRGGGMRLARGAEEINVGDVVRRTEPHFHLVECFQVGQERRCPIEPMCGLKGVLAEAQGAFLGTLDRYTLADLLKEREGLRALLG